MRKVIITGVAGFAGSHLAESLTGRYEVWGVHLDGVLDNLSGIKGVNLYKCDLRDYGCVEELFDRVRPDFIVHLAAQSIPAYSFTHPGETLSINIFTALNVLEAASKKCPGAVILNIGSCEEYGEVGAHELPVRETAELRPLNPYAVSKATQDLLGYQYWKTKGLKVVRVRPFNHFGPRQADNFVTASFARQVAEIEAGIKKEKKLLAGNLEAAKDFIYVKDVVAAYGILMERGEYGQAYNICSGRAVKIREIAETLVCLSSEKIDILEDPSLKRPTDTVAIYGDAGKLRSLGWAPAYGFKEGLEELLDYWRRRVGQAG